MKYLILVVFIVIVWSIWKKRSQVASAEKTPIAPAPEKMLACLYCGVHFPENDGVSDQTGAYCCPAHRKNAAEERI